MTAALHRLTRRLVLPCTACGIPRHVGVDRHGAGIVPACRPTRRVASKKAISPPRRDPGMPGSRRQALPRQHPKGRAA